MIITIFVGIIMVVTLATHRMLNRHLEKQARVRANHYFPDRYFTTRRHAPSKQSLELKGYRLIVRTRKNKTMIPIQQIQRVRAGLHGITIDLKHGDTVRLSLWYTHLADIYAILKYHRPVESRAAISTRTS